MSHNARRKDLATQKQLSHALDAVEKSSGGLISHNVRVSARRTSLRLDVGSPRLSGGMLPTHIATGILTLIEQPATRDHDTPRCLSR
jgi:hypothetical protein